MPDYGFNHDESSFGNRSLKSVFIHGRSEPLALPSGFFFFACFGRLLVWAGFGSLAGSFVARFLLGCWMEWGVAFDCCGVALGFDAVGFWIDLDDEMTLVPFWRSLGECCWCICWSFCVYGVKADWLVYLYAATFCYYYIGLNTAC